MVDARLPDGSRVHAVVPPLAVVTLSIAAWRVPMIVVYRVNTLLWKAAGQFLIKTPKIAMLMIPDPSAARAPSRSQARLKMVGNMIEFIRPMPSRL